MDMKEKLAQSRILPIVAGLLVLVLAVNIEQISAGVAGFFRSKKLPLLELAGNTVEVSKYLYLGSWPIAGDYTTTGKGSTRKWRDAVRLTYDDSRKTFQITPDVSLLNGSIPQRMTPDSEAAIYKGIRWIDNQISVFAFRALSPSKQVAMVEMDTNNATALYINGKFVREMSAVDNIEIGANLLVPVNLNEGENIIVIKVFSSAAPPRLRVSLISDQSKDFQSAWNDSWGFLNKVICGKKGGTFESPVVRWDSKLDRMTVQAEVCDALTGNIVYKNETLRNANVIRDGSKALGEGVYKITYKSNAPQPETASEYFLVGSPKEAYQLVRKSLGALSWSAPEKLNIEAQTRKAEILFDSKYYVPNSKEWQVKVTWTIGSLAEFVNLKVTQTSKSALPAQQQAGLETCDTNIFKDMTGLQLRGFISKIDNSKQFYRLFVPSNYTAGKKLPLLLIMPVTIAVKARTFLEDPSRDIHRQAVQICGFAEKFGFGVLWPGYRNAQEGWTYEAEHAAEALSDVEANYNIDSSKISLYGICSGGVYAGRLASIYPNRFAAIVYDRAVFDRDADSRGEAPDLRQWFQAISPTRRIIANQNLKIFVLNDGSRVVGHGEIELSQQFLNAARMSRPDIKSALGTRQMGVGLWHSIFEFLRDCKNEHPSRERVDVPAESGYVGPISEVFATPFIVVEGTRFKPEDAGFMSNAIENLKAQYRDQFYGDDFIIKKDSEVTDEDVGKYSLVLVGNAGSNAVWGRLAAKYADSITPYIPKDDLASSPSRDVFAEVFKNPANKNNYLLLIGSNELGNMAFLRDFNPFKAWFDCYFYKYWEGHEKEYITARRP